MWELEELPCRCCEVRLTDPQCDEGQPRCSACERHNVSCDYVHSSNSGGAHEALPTPPIENPSNASVPEHRALDPRLDPMLELQLMHAWTAYTFRTFSTAWEFWGYQAPLIALEFRHVLDAMFALAALHESRQPSMQWAPTEARSKSKMTLFSVSQRLIVTARSGTKAGPVSQFSAPK